MTSVHTQAILDNDPIYLTGEKIHIPVTGRRSYSHRIQVHKRRSIKPQLVKDELKFQAVKTRQFKAYVDRLLQPRPGVVERFLNRLKRKRG